MAAIVALVSFAAQAVTPALDLSDYQEKSGLIGTFKGGTVADPYFGLYALELAHRAGLNARKAESAFVKWGLANQQADGRFGRYCRTENVWAYCGRADSDDATLSRWLVSLTRAAEGKPFPPEWQSSFEKAKTALFTLKMKNGVFSVFSPSVQGYAGYALYKDNIEVLNAFETLSRLFKERQDSNHANFFENEASSLRKAIGVRFGKNPMNLKELALGARYDHVRFYPHQVAAPFASLEGYFSMSQADWSQWLEQSKKAWDENGAKDFPWGILALSAHQSGLPGVACDWLEQYKPNRSSNVRWNVLEEVSAQIILSKTRALADCN